ncbi:MAG: germination protein YpeB [Clostridia bacterium]|nr:germination protein YpeB [Clostridia bacterium]
MKKLSKRNLARIVAFLAAGLCALALFTGMALVKAGEYERKTEAMYEQNLAQANEYLSDIGDVILKGIYSNSAADQSSMCADVWMNAYEAKNAISALPLADVDMEQCYTFLSKTAEYARAAQKSISGGKTIDDAAHKTFLEIKSKTASLAKDFEKLQNIYLSSGQKISGGIDFSFEKPKTIATSSATGEGLKTLNKNLSDAPKLIYDGPYSDTVQNKNAKMLQNEAKIDVKKATEIAENFLKKHPGTLSYAGKEKGNIPAYRFTKGNAYVLVSIAGGKVISFNTNEQPSKTAVSQKKCLQAAAEYLKSAGYLNMQCDYYELANHIYVMNFHYVEGDVNCYTDLIKIKLNAQNGKVCGMDASGYLSNHTRRNLDFKLSAAQAQAGVSGYLRTKAIKKALIPTPAGSEKLCYEYRCVSPEGNELLVFIDADTGKQADLLILQITENGVLTK